MRYRLLVLAFGTFAVGTGSFVFAGLRKRVAALGLTTLGLMGGFVVFTYVSPLLAEITGFALNPLQQYRVAGLAPSTRNVAFSLNASAIYLGQGVGLGALALATGSLCALTAFALPLPTIKTRQPEVAPEG